MSGEVEPAVDAALAIFGENDLLRPLAESFGESAADALAQQGRTWFQKGVTTLWSSARKRVVQSKRIPKTPRVQAAIEISKHGVAEERPDLREAYENLAARSMTEDEWGHHYEEYSQRISKLQSGDITILRAVDEETRIEHEATSTGILVFMTFTRLKRHVNMTMTDIMDSVDRLEANGLLIVRTSRGERQQGSWCIEGNNSDVSLDAFSLLPRPRGAALLDHIADLEPHDQPDPA